MKKYLLILIVHSISLAGGNFFGTTSAGNLSHNSLSGLTVDDPHTQYAFLAGRAGGQTLTGGTASADNLTLQGNSTGGGVNGQIILGANGVRMGGSSGFFSAINGSLGLLPTSAVANRTLFIGAATNTVATSPTLRFYRTGASDAAVPSGASLGNISTGGSTGASIVTNIKAVEMLATEAWSTTARGQSTTFNVTPNTTIVETPALKLEQNADVTISTGNLIINTAGKGLQVKEGSNAKMGTGTCNGSTEVTISTTAVTANSRIFYSFQATGGVPLGVVYTSARSAGTSFGFKCAATDTSTVAWLLVEPS